MVTFKLGGYNNIIMEQTPEPANRHQRREKEKTGIIDNGCTVEPVFKSPFSCTVTPCKCDKEQP